RDRRRFARDRNFPRLERADVGRALCGRRRVPPRHRCRRQLPDGEARARSPDAARARARRHRRRARHVGRRCDVERGTAVVFPHGHRDDVALRVGGCEARRRAPMRIFRGIVLIPLVLEVTGCQDATSAAPSSHPDAGGSVESGTDGDAAESGTGGGSAGTTGCEPRFPYQDEPDHGTWLGGDSAFSIALSPTLSLWTFQDTFVAGHGETTRANAHIVAGTVALASCTNGVYA